MEGNTVKCEKTKETFRKPKYKKNNLLKKFKFSWQFHLMILPGMLLIIVFCYLPMYGVIIAFKDFVPNKGILGSAWVGLKWFDYMFQLPDVWLVTKNTFIIAGLKILLGFPVPIIFALLLNEVRRGWLKKGIQTIVYLPNFLSWVILAGLILDVFALNNGLVNQFITWLGFKPLYFLGDNQYFRGLLIGTDIWKNFGWGTVIYMAALTGVDTALYEAAVIDGANRWKQTLYVTLPAIVPIILLSGILSLGNVLNAGFEQIFNLYNPLVMQSGDIIDTYVYRLAFMDANWSLSTAVGLLKSFVSTIFVCTGYWLAFKFTDYKIF